jgi:hypothetical protein
VENLVFLSVLFAALCHAGWNALIKVGLDPLSTTTLISIGSGIVALVFLPLVGLLALADRLGDHPPRLFRRADRGLSYR